MIECKIKIDLDSFILDANFSIPDKGVTVIFGPSGSGKTTLLRALAGLEENQNGYLKIVLFDRNLGINIAPNKRRIGYVFQDGRLFPHMSVAGNLRFGKQFATNPLAPKSEQRIIDMLGLGQMLARRPGTLSGGEKQRVAIGRALLSDPRMLIMDEPLAALDTARKAEILPYLERLRDEAALPILYISHAMDEIARLADTLVLLQAGRVMRTGPINTMLTRFDLPMSHGKEATSLIDAIVVGREKEFDLMQLDFPGGQFTVPDNSLEVNSSVRLRVSARDVSLTKEKQIGTSILNIFPAIVDELSVEGGAQIMVRLKIKEVTLLALITRKSAEMLNLKNGVKVFAQIKSVAILS